MNNKLRKCRNAAAVLLLAITVTSIAAVAEQRGGPTPSPKGAEVYFVDLKDGATVPSKLTIYFGLRNMGVRLRARIDPIPATIIS